MSESKEDAALQGNEPIEGRSSSATADENQPKLQDTNSWKCIELNRDVSPVPTWETGFRRSMRLGAWLSTLSAKEPHLQQGLVSSSQLMLSFKPADKNLPLQALVFKSLTVLKRSP